MPMTAGPVTYECFSCCLTCISLSDNDEKKVHFHITGTMNTETQYFLFLNV